VPESRILLGVVGRPHGVRGLMRVTSYANPPEAIVAYGPLSDDHGRQFSLRWRGDGLVEITEIVGGTSVRIADRTAAERLTNRRLYIARDTLPQPAPDEFYLADLVGLAAVDAGGTEIGTVVGVHDYGAGASLEIADDGGAPLLVPFTRTAVPAVDIGAGRITVAPPEEVDVLPPGPLPPPPSHKGRGSR
jgi:16S rRNA processing protein RimM